MQKPPSTPSKAGPKHHHGALDQVAANNEVAGRHQAAALMRRKVAGILAGGLRKNGRSGQIEPLAGPRSTHEAFLYDLLDSQKSLADMITAWHAYYDSLPAA